MVEKSKSAGVIYARYSSHSQRDVSIDQQLKECKKFAEKNGISIVKVYDDRALTGTSDKRPMFQAMIAEAQDMNYQYVIVYSLDRFARDRYDSAVYKQQLKSYGKKVLSATENIADDPTGVLMESLLEGLAEYYSKELSRKIRRGMDDNAEKCMANGALPYGYHRGADGKYEISPHEAEVVREIYTRTASGEHLIDIAKSLNERGLRTKSGAKWNKSSFNRILSNERYCGIYMYNDIRVEGGIPTIIERQLFDDVQQRIRTKPNPRSDLPNRRRRSNGIYLLTGKLFCGKCGSPMRGESGKSSVDRLHYYYICNRRRNEKSCDMHRWRRDELEREIVAAIKINVLTDEMIPAIADIAIRKQEESRNDDTIVALNELLKSITASIDNLISAIEKGTFSASIQNRLFELEEQRKNIENEISFHKSKTEAPITREDLIAVLYMFKDGDIDDKDFQEKLIDAFLVAAYVYDDHIHIVFNVGSGEKSGKEIDREIIEKADERCRSFKGDTAPPKFFIRTPRKSSLFKAFS